MHSDTKAHPKLDKVEGHAKKTGKKHETTKVWVIDQAERK